MFGGKWRLCKYLLEILICKDNSNICQILNGRLVDETLIKMAEMLSPNNIQQLQDDLSAVDLCSQKSAHLWKYDLSLTGFFAEGMDDCDTAALTFQCGQEKAPGLLANAIASVELSSEMVTALLHRIYEFKWVIRKLISFLGKVTSAANSRCLHNGLQLCCECIILYLSVNFLLNTTIFLLNSLQSNKLSHHRQVSFCNII